MPSPREQLAHLLKQAREQAGFDSQGALAKKAQIDRSVVSKGESPRQPTPSDTALAAIAGATGVSLDRLKELAQQARQGWFATWIDYEARASVIRWFEPLLIPGLLQTEAYANAVLTWKPDSASAQANLSKRLERQSVLDRAMMRVIILESVLHREVGDAAVMSEQIDHLLTVGSRPSVALQVVPDSASVAGALGGAFAIASEGPVDLAAYSESNIQGGVHTDPDLIARATELFDGLRADALPWGQTQDHLKKAGERWTL